MNSSSAHTIGVGQIGIGYWAPSLLKTISHHGLFSLKCIADPAEQNHAFVRALFPQTYVTTSVNAIFANPEIELVVIATHAQNHSELALAALRAGKHVLVERPLALDYESFYRIAAEAEARNLVVMSSQVSLYSAAISSLCRVVHSGALGEVRSISTQRLNFAEPRQDLDVLWHYGATDIGIINLLLNNPRLRGVSRWGIDLTGNGVEDTTHLNIDYENTDSRTPVQAHIHVSWGEPETVRRIVVVGTDRMAVLDECSEVPLTVFDRGHPTRPADRAPLQKGLSLVADRGPGSLELFGDDPSYAQLSHLFECIRYGRECLGGRSHAHGVLQVLLSAERTPMSIRTDHHSRPSLQFASEPAPRCPAQIIAPQPFLGRRALQKEEWDCVANRATPA